MRGYLFGLGHFGAGVGWTWASLHHYGHLPLAAAGLIAGLLAAALAGYCAAAAAAASALAGRRPAAALAALPGCWLLAEILRSKLFTGFGWLSAGYAQVPASPLAGLLPLIGQTGATGAVAAAAAGLAAAALLPSVRARLTGLACAALLLGGGLALKGRAWTEPAGPPVAVSVLQGAIPQDEQWLRENIIKLPVMYADMAMRSEGQLILAPEAAVPRRLRSMPAELLVDPLAKAAAARDGAVLLGAFGYSPERDRHYNSVFAIGSEGIAAEYSKRKLTPYGEYLPFADVLEPLLERARIPYSRLIPGNGSGLVDLGFVELGMTICYEDAFPDLLRTNAAALLANFTNDSWFDGTAMPAQHLQIAATRALEAGRMLVRASNTGPSAVIGPDGRVRAALAPGERGILEASAIPYAGRTPYHAWGDVPAYLLGLAMLAAGVLLRRFP